jgi:hypothetical protein
MATNTHVSAGTLCIIACIQQLIEDQGTGYVFVNDDIFRNAALLPAWATRESIDKQVLIECFNARGYDILDWVPGRPAGLSDSDQPVHLELHLGSTPDTLFNADSDHCNIFRARNNLPKHPL